LPLLLLPSVCHLLASPLTLVRVKGEVNVRVKVKVNVGVKVSTQGQGQGQGQSHGQGHGLPFKQDEKLGHTVVHNRFRDEITKMLVLRYAKLPYLVVGFFHPLETIVQGGRRGRAYGGLGGCGGGGGGGGEGVHLFVVISSSLIRAPLDSSKTINISVNLTRSIVSGSFTIFQT
jgi:hypothetical protein